MDWNEIFEKSFKFSRLLDQVAVLETITLEEVRSWYRVNLCPGSPARRKLGVWVVGTQLERVEPTLTTDQQDSEHTSLSASLSAVQLEDSPNQASERKMITLEQFQATNELGQCLHNLQINSRLAIAFGVAE